MSLSNDLVEMSKLVKRSEDLMVQLSAAVDVHRVRPIIEDEETLRVRVHVIVDEILDTNLRAAELARRYGVI